MISHEEIPGRSPRDAKGLARLVCAVLAFVAAASPARAATVFLGNDGVDGPGCGAKTAPCRSINRGLGAAADGDTIVVGPGRYGDLDHDGVLSGAGEEHPNPLGFNCQCAIPRGWKLEYADSW